MNWFVRLWYRLVLPYHCPSCGQPYRGVTPQDLAPQVLEEYLRRRKLWLLHDCYRCDRCDPPHRCVMVL